MLFYKLEMSYPNGRVEEIEETFKSKKDAFDYGVSLLTQILNTENTKVGSSGDKQMPYFLIVEYKDGGRRIVYSSKDNK